MAAAVGRAGPPADTETTKPAVKQPRPAPDRGPRDRPRQSRWRTGLLKKGQDAPDFELPLLVEETDKAGNKANRITDKKVKLSSFRGKQLVCVFFSSYT